MPSEAKRQRRRDNLGYDRRGLTPRGWSALPPEGDIKRLATPRARRARIAARKAARAARKANRPR